MKKTWFILQPVHPGTMVLVVLNHVVCAVSESPVTTWPASVLMVVEPAGEEKNAKMVHVIFFYSPYFEWGMRTLFRYISICFVEASNVLLRYKNSVAKSFYSHFIEYVIQQQQDRHSFINLIYIYIYAVKKSTKKYIISEMQIKWSFF